LPDDTFSGTMRQILDKGGLKMKVIVPSGEPEEADNRGGLLCAQTNLKCYLRLIQIIKVCNFFRSFPNYVWSFGAKIRISF
jgi:hypothetical protein